MHFTSATSSDGVIERNFVVGEVTGVLWSPASRSVGGPLLLLGHSGGMHKQSPGLVANALHSVTGHGFTVAAIDAPGHGDRPRNRQDEQWAGAIHQARAAGEPIAPIVIDYSMSLARRAVPEWQATLDVLQACTEIGADAPVGYGGVSLGVVTGLQLAAVEPRIAALSLGGVFVDDTLIESARRISVPVEYWIPWDNSDFNRTYEVALFDAFGSAEKTLHAHSGRPHSAPEHARDSSARFFVSHLGRAANSGSD
ncbi:hypothetical protein A5761_16760 [Mycolicibacterium setense]|uniref:alpha/beta hydrolase n=1 Tax=Mycolicibacterium setense TaxID=431269 RepID=UPI0007E95CA1|nr:alpha/beta hydrolase [Mycolicibacterium setense]OBB14496.1 hypothetical protein A5761_16760 [Mycolicibacterium setense]